MLLTLYTLLFALVTAPLFIRVPEGCDFFEMYNSGKCKPIQAIAVKKTQYEIYYDDFQETLNATKTAIQSAIEQGTENINNMIEELPKISEMPYVQALFPKPPEKERFDQIVMSYIRSAYFYIFPPEVEKTQVEIYFDEAKLSAISGIQWMLGTDNINSIINLLPTQISQLSIVQALVPKQTAFGTMMKYLRQGSDIVGAYRWHVFTVMVCGFFAVLILVCTYYHLYGTYTHPLKKPLRIVDPLKRRTLSCSALDAKKCSRVIRSIQGCQVITSLQSDVKPSKSTCVKLNYDSNNLANYQIKCELKKCHFGQVLLSHNDTDGRLVAVKKIAKAALLRKDLKAEDKDSFMYCKRALNELRMLLKLKGTTRCFIINLETAFQTFNDLCYSLEYCCGGNFLDLVKTHPGHPYNAMQYSAQVLKAVTYLHENNIVHRNIHTANLLLTGKGELRLTGFQHAIEVKDAMKSEIKGKVGFIGYMAPEMIVGIGYNCMVDYYSVGCVLYEMLEAHLPFRGRCYGDLKWATMLGQHTFKHTTDKTAMDCVSGFLLKDPEQRLGLGFKTHPFYRDYYQKVWNKEVKLNVIPLKKMNREDDLCYFPDNKPYAEDKKTYKIPVEQYEHLFQDFVIE